MNRSALLTAKARRFFSRKMKISATTRLPFEQGQKKNI
jgi:hypothetical protein